ncbi:hypothetical protein KC678_02865 [Candidatus Dojkabacteria bacterium]|uniref:Uncharacterized protein n=1 Tax=Candidatus Dojkabacteria bacterium TaxID=2099670 RepID=A0A955L0L7_9BACT|nr:hypothetical protein [Candidatus Dojkabacteria bacterium]
MTKKLHTDIGKAKKNFESIFEWTSAERPWEPKQRAWYVYYSLFFLVFIAYAALRGQYLLMLMIISFVFLWFIQGATPPQESKHIITTLGIKTFNKLFKWNSIKYYWFSIKGEYAFLNLDVIDKEFTSGHRVHRLSLLINPNDMEKLFEILSKYIDYGNHEEVAYNVMTRAINGKYIDIFNFLSDKNSVN